jgi:hypothetical protein
VNASPNFKLERLVPSGAGEGDYEATISFDTAAENVTEYVLALVLNTGDDQEPVLVSSAPFVVLPGASLQAAPPANCYIVPYGDSVIIDLKQITNEVAAGFRAAPRVAPTDNVTMELLWADQQEDILTSVAITALTPPNRGTRSMFSVKSDWPHVGNAIVAARVGSEVVWSWQIWLTDYDPDTQNHTHTTSGVTSEATPDAGKELVFMDRNLGAWGNSGGVETLGMLYQWGRKDPFPGNFKGFPWYGGGTGEPRIYTPAVPTGTEDAIAIVNASVSSGIDFATANPMTFIANGREDEAPYDEHSWYSYEGGGPRKLWVDTTDGGATLHKSVYDPCPPGWRVPAEGSHTILMGGSDDGESPYGVTMNAGPYFPYAGMRRQDGGRPVMDMVTTCWFGQSYFDHTAYNLYAAPPGGAPAYQGDALPVRCVKVAE